MPLGKTLLHTEWSQGTGVPIGQKSNDGLGEGGHSAYIYATPGEKCFAGYKDLTLSALGLSAELHTPSPEAACLNLAVLWS